MVGMTMRFNAHRLWMPYGTVIPGSWRPRTWGIGAHSTAPRVHGVPAGRIGDTCNIPRGLPPCRRLFGRPARRRLVLVRPWIRLANPSSRSSEVPPWINFFLFAASASLNLKQLPCQIVNGDENGANEWIKGCISMCRAPKRQRERRFFATVNEDYRCDKTTIMKDGKTL